jgi:hypothetical protein
MEDDVPANKNPAISTDSQQELTALPVYQKPVLRRYNQIGQVKPYGPSDLESG